jgi:hypothetical protein
MSISSKIQEKMDEIGLEYEARQLNKKAPTPATKDLEEKILNVIHGKQKAWEEFASLFVETAAELARLTPTNDDLDDEKQRARIYLFANATCTMESINALNYTVENKLD